MMRRNAKITLLNFETLISSGWRGYVKDDCDGFELFSFVMLEF
jgi:hypothetical protein